MIRLATPFFPDLLHLFFLEHIMCCFVPCTFDKTKKKPKPQTPSVVMQLGQCKMISLYMPFLSQASAPYFLDD